MSDRPRRVGSNGVQIICAECGKTAWKRQSEAASRFCSNSCAARHRWPVWMLGIGPNAAAAALRTTEVSRFWNRVCQKSPDQCWEWTGVRDKRGYGRVSWRGKYQLTHRVALSLTDGQWDNKLNTLHTCDNPPCCNPAHLWRGTPADNANDRDRKGRTGPRQRGEDKPNTRLTEAVVIAIRNSNLPGSKLAAMYGIGKTTVLTIKRRDRWRHIP